MKRNGIIGKWIDMDKVYMQKHIIHAEFGDFFSNFNFKNLFFSQNVPSMCPVTKISVTLINN